jgi:hypothetical protein
MSQSLIFLLQGAALALIVFEWERSKSSSLGFSKPYFADLLLALSAWIFYQIGFRFIFFHFHSFFSSGGSSDLAIFSLPTHWFITLMALDIVYEEVATRAYVIERMISFTGSRILAGTVSFVLSIALHIPGRDLRQAVRRTPMMVLLTALYLWRRSMLPCALTHVLIDTGVYLLLFQFPWLLVWVFHPVPASVLLVVSMALWACAQSIEQKIGSNRAMLHLGIRR